MRGGGGGWNLIGSQFEFLHALTSNDDGFSLDLPVVLILACRHVCTHECVCVCVAQLVGDRGGRNVNGWLTDEPLRTVSGPGTPDGCSADRNL